MIDEIIKDLQGQIEREKECYGKLDEADWITEEGVILSVNDADSLLYALAKAESSLSAIRDAAARCRQAFNERKHGDVATMQLFHDIEAILKEG